MFMPVNFCLGVRVKYSKCFVGPYIARNVYVTYDDDNDWFGLLYKMCNIFGQALTTKLQKRIWHIKTAVMNSAEYVPHVWHIRSVPYKVRQSFFTYTYFISSTTLRLFHSHLTYLFHIYMWVICLCVYIEHENFETHIHVYIYTSSRHILLLSNS